MFKKIFSLKTIDHGIVLIILFSLFKLLLHLIFNANYNFHSDEFYYVACSQNFDFGYVDHPSFIALIAKLTTSALGESIQALRFLPALAGSLTVFFTGLFVRKVGGGKFAIIIALLAAIFSPLILFSNNVFSAEVFAQPFWIFAFFILVKITIDSCEKCWLLLGIVIGIGLQISYSVVFLLFGIFIFIVFTSSRKYFKIPYLWIGFSFVIIMNLPNIYWQFSNDFPTWEYLTNLFNNDSNSIHDLLWKQIIRMHPVSTFLVVLGIIYIYISDSLVELKKFGWIYISVLFFLFLSNINPSYFLSVYLIIFAFGAVGLSELLTKYSLNWLKYLLLIIIVPIYIFLTPMSLPILPTQLYIKYENRMDFRFLLFENIEKGKLPQHFADMFGWEKFVQSIALVYKSLDDKQKADCKILVRNKSEAGAMDFYANDYELPKVLCGHNNYWIWGPGDFDGKLMIVTGGGLKRNMDFFEEVEPVEIIQSEFAWVEESNVPIYICKNLKIPVDDFWKQIKRFN